MSNKVQLYAQMADRTAEQITGSYQKWTAFLTTSARLYKYPYRLHRMQKENPSPSTTRRERISFYSITA